MNLAALAVLRWSMGYCTNSAPIIMPLEYRMLDALVSMINGNQ